MSDNWSQIKQEVDNHRNYVKSLPDAAKAAGIYSLILPKEEIDRLLALKEGATLDGLRIFLGAKEIEGHLVPTLHIIAVEKIDGAFTDYNVPKTLPETPAAPAALFASAEPAGGVSTGNGYPCPPTCNGTHILNND